MTFYGHFCHYLGTLLPPSNTRASFLSGYTHDTDFVPQSQTMIAPTPQLRIDIFQQLGALTNDVNSYVQSFLSAGVWVDNSE